MPPEFASHLASHLSLPTGITGVKSQLPATSLPTPPLATDASVSSIRDGPLFPFSQAPDTPITPANSNFPHLSNSMTPAPGTPEFARLWALRRPEVGPLPSSAATHFNFDTPPQSAPPTQSSFSEQELFHPYPKHSFGRNHSTIYLASSPLEEERELCGDEGDISFQVPYSSHDSRTPTIQYPNSAMPMSFDFHNYHSPPEFKKEPSYEESLFSEIDQGVSVLHGAGVRSPFEHVTHVPMHDSAPGYDNFLSMTASAGFNSSRHTAWQG